MYAAGLRLIRLSDDRVVLKRGIHEVLISGADAGSIVEPLLDLLDGSRTREQILEAFPGHLRADVDLVLAAMTARRLVLSESPPPGSDGAGGLQPAFYANFGPSAEGALAKLRASSVVVVGATLIARSLVRSLLEMEVGGVTLAGHAVLGAAAGDGRPGEEVPAALRDRFRIAGRWPPEPGVGGFSMVCATSDFGEADALLEVNRLALAAGRPFLPAWLGEMVGYVGPLNIPFETACLRCYRLRAASNDAEHDVRRAVRERITVDPDARAATGLLPPMAGILGEVAAMEVAKLLGQFVPSDAVGRLIEVNLVSFRSTVRRVLKIPRCPDCSDAVRRAPMTVAAGPQIPHRG